MMQGLVYLLLATVTYNQVHSYVSASYSMHVLMHDAIYACLHAAILILAGWLANIYKYFQT